MRFTFFAFLISFPMILFAQGRVGINTDTPDAQLDIRALTTDEPTVLNLGNLADGYFTRLLSGHPGFPVSSLSWASGTPFNFGSWDGVNFTQMMQISPLRRVGINTFDPLFNLDVRGTDDTADGGEFQLATPGQTNFLRFFGGRLGDRNPFMAFHDLDTFHIVTTLPDFSTYTRRLTMLPDGRIGIGTQLPAYRLTVESNTVGDTLIAGEAFATNGVNIGVFGRALNSQGIGVKGFGGDVGVHGESTNGNGLEGKGVLGVLGYSPNGNGYGVYGIANAGSGESHGIYGTSYSDSGIGVKGFVPSATGTTYGVLGQSLSPDGYGVAGVGETGVLGKTGTNSGIGVYGLADYDQLGGAIGVFGESLSEGGGIGVQGEGAIGIKGVSTNFTGGTSVGVSGTGLIGVEGTGQYGVWGTSDDGYGVRGSVTGTGLFGNSAGVQGIAYEPGVYAIYGANMSTVGETFGIFGSTASPNGSAVFGKAKSASGSSIGVSGESAGTGGKGVYGKTSATSGLNYGVYGESFSSNGRGVFGYAQAFSGMTRGVVGVCESPDGTGVLGNAYSGSGNTKGVHGIANSSNGTGIYGESSGTNGKALYGYADGVYGKGLHVITTGKHSSVNSILAVANTEFDSDAFAGYFIGDVFVDGSVSKSGGSFKIDHPLDPENKYLYHSFVESPDMMNIYNGNVTTDASGHAVVELPEYFETLNMDFRYQLTVIGTFAQAIIGEEISGNRFTIMTDQPNVKVSWQVTGIRQDPWAEQNRIQPEVQKEPENTGKYLNPEVYGQPEALRIGNAESFRDQVN